MKKFFWITWSILSLLVTIIGISIYIWSDPIIGGLITTIAWGFACLVLTGIILVIPTAILFIFLGLVQKYRPNTFGNPKNIVQKISISSGVTTWIALFILPIVLTGIAWGINTYKPAQIPTYTLSNGEQTVIFQSMSHIGSKDFYTTVRDQMDEYKESGYTVYFEGIKPGKPENIARFSELLGIDFDLSFYPKLSTLLGLKFQSDYFLSLVFNSEYRNVDVSIDDLIEAYDAQEGNNLETTPPETLNLDSAMLAYKQLSFRQRKALHQFTHAGMNLMTQNEDTMSELLESSSDFLQNIILDLRNEYVAQEILSGNDEYIYLMYGALHYQGIFALLQESDESWEVTDISYTQLIQN